MTTDNKTIVEKLDDAQSDEEFGQLLQGLFLGLESARDTASPTLDNSRYRRRVICMITFFLAVAILALAVFVIAGYAVTAGDRGSPYDQPLTIHQR